MRNHRKVMFNLLINYYCSCCGLVTRTIMTTSDEPNLQKVLDNKEYDYISEGIIAIEDELCNKCK